MSENHDKRKIWYYAVILFTSAFVVLLLTAYSQIKFNKNIDDYKSQLSSGEQEKNKFRMDLNSALKENQKLTETIEEIRQELNKTKGEKSDQEKNATLEKEGYAQSISSYKALVQAQQAYQNKEYIAAAELLKNDCDTSFYDDKTLESYNTLTGVVYKEAEKTLYNIGMSYYAKKQYAEAANYYLKAMEYGTSGLYGDECYYYLAYSHYWMGNTEQAKGYVNQLLSAFPNTPYSKGVEKLQRLMGG